MHSLLGFCGLVAAKPPGICTAIVWHLYSVCACACGIAAVAIIPPAIAATANTMNSWFVFISLPPLKVPGGLIH